MSSINGVSSSNAWLQQMQSSGQTREAPSGPPPGPPPGHNEAIESVAEEAGLSSSEISDLMAKLDEAAESAKNNGDDPESVKDRMDSILEEAGIDTSSLKEKLSSIHGGGPNGKPPQGYGQDGTSSQSVQSGSGGIFEMLQSLPVGSLIDSAA